MESHAVRKRWTFRAASDVKRSESIGTFRGCSVFLGFFGRSLRVFGPKPISIADLFPPIDEQNRRRDLRRRSMPSRGEVVIAERESFVSEDQQERESLWNDKFAGRETQRGTREKAWAVN